MDVQQLSVFLSYAHQDRAIAKSIAKELGKAGLRVWIDEGELRAGDSIIDRIATAIAEVEFVVALLSENSVSSQWCTKELALAVNSGLEKGRVRVLPVRIDNVGIPASIKDTYCLQMSSRNVNQILNQPIKDVRSHHEKLLERQDQRFRYRVVPPSVKSSIDARTARRLKTALISRRIKLARWPSRTWDAVFNAQRTLMNDYSVPAMDLLFECSVEDHRRSWVAGFATSGLILLAPASAPWIKKLLTHRNRRVALETLSQLIDHDEILLQFPSRSAFPLRDVSRVIVLEIKRGGNWLDFKKRVANYLKKENAFLRKRYSPKSKKYVKFRKLRSQVTRALAEVDFAGRAKPCGRLRLGILARYFQISALLIG